MNSSTHFRIATWNLERPKQNGWVKNQRCLDKIAAIEADIWVLTETNSAICLKDKGYTAVESSSIQGYHQASEHLSTIWSAWKVLDCIPTFDAETAVCAEIESPYGAMIVYGTVLPYANDKGLSGTAKRWQEQRQSIQQHYQDWLRIQKQYPYHLMCIAGDFNQSRDRSGWYEDKQSVEMLNVSLHGCSLVCVTDENLQARGLSRATVDHIFLSKSLKPHMVKMDAWEGKTLDNQKMSDHNGIFVDLL